MTFSRKPLATLISLLLVSSPALSQSETQSNDIEKVIVRGALISTPLSEMAASISVLDEIAIEQRQAQHLEDLFNRAANVNFSSGASRGRFVQIRGIGERSQFTDPVNPSVGYLVDGINYSGLLAGASTFDVEQVEIFKGPNSARFGAEGLAGVINVITKDAAPETTFDGQFGIANFDSWNLGLAQGGSVTDKLDYRVSFHKNKSDGFIDNTFLNKDNTNNIDEQTSRLKLNWRVNKNFSLRTALHLIDVDNGYDAFSLDLNRTTFSDQPGFDRQDSKAVSVVASLNHLTWANLEISASALNADLEYGFDEDWSFVGLHPDEYSSFDSYFRDRKDKSLEVKFTSKALNKNSWVIGGYFADEQEDLVREYTFLSNPFTSEVEIEDLAIFGQKKYVLSDTQWLSLSLRFASQTFDYRDSNNLERKIDNNDWGTEFSYHQLVSDESMIYLSLVRSYKMGGVNGQALSRVDDIEDPTLRQTLINNTEFEPESLLGVEFGIKGQNQEGSLAVDLALFYQDRSDVQVKSSLVEGQSFVDVINNASSGSNFGLEVSVNYNPNDTLALFSNIGFLNTKINGFVRQDGEFIDGRDQAHAPSYHVNIGSLWQMSENLSWLFEVDAKDEYFYSFSHDNRSEKIVIAHTSLDYSLKDWNFSFYVRNLFDRDYANRGFFFGNDPRDNYTAKVYEQFGEPRRVGLNVSFSY
jgi:outer membrane receptor protein involved in Fe transport